MKKTFFVLSLIVLLVTGSPKSLPTESVSYSEEFNFPLLSPEHKGMRRLLTNAMGYLKPEHQLVDPLSGYPVEGWNQEPSRGLYLRSFTQLTAIGMQLELLASIAAGYADNPYISRIQALDHLDLMLSSLLADQNDAHVSYKGLLGNFLGFSATGRIGPLSEEVQKQAFVDAFGEEQAIRIWAALITRKWIVSQQDGSFAKISRKSDYGDKFFTGHLAPFDQSDAKAKIMAILDARVVQIVFGDNANLTASAAKALGALLRASIKDDPAAVGLRGKLERFIAEQEGGYEQLYDEKSGTFFFGFNATRNRYSGWEDSRGEWIVGHMDYLVNEFRGPLTFVMLRFGLPSNAIKNSGFKIKPYQRADGRDVYTLATWNGSAFESLGLSLFMQELHLAGWRENLENSVAIELDFSRRHQLPGFLSEAYSGNDLEYTGTIGIPDVAVTDQPRVTDAPSLYSLGTAYWIQPEKIETFIKENWDSIERLLTDHGPWEGINTTQDKAIEFQTTAHTLGLILGGIGSAEENMQRYLTWKGLSSSTTYGTGVASIAVDFLSAQVQWIPWSPTGDPLNLLRETGEIGISANAIGNGAMTVKRPQDGSFNLSNGALLIRYRTAKPLAVVMTLSGGPRVFHNEILTRFNVTHVEQSIRIPMPATPGLEHVTELVLRFGDEGVPLPVDLTITGFEFVPAQ